jgi:hypothetical protein
MNDEHDEHIERSHLNLQMRPAPSHLRSAVLSDVERELRAARWDRRLARAAAVLLAVGISMNMLTSVAPRSAPRVGRADLQAPESLTSVAVAVAETTDANTGRQFVRRLAALAGWSLGGEQAAAIDAAVNRRFSRDGVAGKDG